MAFTRQLDSFIYEKNLNFETQEQPEADRWTAWKPVFRTIQM